MMNPLLNQLLMRRIRRIKNLNRLIIAFPTPRIRNLQSRTRNQHQQRQPLRIHTCLHEFLRRSQVPIPGHEAQADRHTEQPRGGDNWIAVFPAKGLNALPRGAVGNGLGEGARGHVLVLLELGVAGGFEATRGPVCADDGDEGAGGGHEERSEGDRELSDDGPAALEEETETETAGTAEDAAGCAADEDGAVVGLGGGGGGC